MGRVVDSVKRSLGASSYERAPAVPAVVGDANSVGATRCERGIFRSVDGVLSSRQSSTSGPGAALLTEIPTRGGPR